jgi:hypothetical protein
MIRIGSCCSTTDQDVQRLAREADRVHDLAGEEDVADQLLVEMASRGGRLAFHGAETGRVGQDLPIELGRIALLLRGRRGQREREHRQSEQHGPHHGDDARDPRR